MLSPRYAVWQNAQQLPLFLQERASSKETLPGFWLAFWLVWLGSWLAFWLVWFGSWLAFWLVWLQALAVQRARGGRPGDCQRGARERFARGFAQQKRYSYRAYIYVGPGLIARFARFRTVCSGSPCRNAAAGHFASISRGHYFAATRLFRLRILRRTK